MASLICGGPSKAPRNQGFMQGEEKHSNAPPKETKHLVVIRPKRRLRTSKGLTASAWRKAFDSEGRPTNITKLLAKVQRGGIDPSIRPEVWELLLGVWPLESTEAERTALRKKHRDLYAETLGLCQKIHPGLGTGKLAYAVNESRILDARSSSRTSAAGETAPKELSPSDRAVPLNDGNVAKSPDGDPLSSSPKPEQLGWGAKFLFDIAKRGLSPEGKEGLRGHDVTLEYYADANPSERELLTQSLEAEVQTPGLEPKAKTRVAGPNAETQGLGAESLSQGLEWGPSTSVLVTQGMSQGLGTEGLTQGLVSEARSSGLVGTGEPQELGTEALIRRLGAGAETHTSGANADTWVIGGEGQNELQAGLQNQAEEKGAGSSEDRSAGAGSLVREVPETKLDSCLLAEEPNLGAGLELTPGLSANVGPPDVPIEGGPKGLVNPMFESTAQATLGTGSLTAVGGVLEDNLTVKRETPDITLGVTPKTSPTAGKPLVSEAFPEPTSLLTLEETKTPVFETTSVPTLEVEQEKAVAASESGSSAKPPQNPASLGRVKTMVAEIERRTSEQEEANRQSLARKPSSVGGVKRGLGSTAAGAELELKSGGELKGESHPPWLKQTDRVKESLPAASEGAFKLTGEQLERGEPLDLSAEEPIGSEQAGMMPAGRTNSAGGAECVEGAESGEGVKFFAGAESVAGTDSVGGAESAGGTESGERAESVAGAESGDGTESVAWARSVGGAESGVGAESVAGAESVGGTESVERVRYFKGAEGVSVATAVRGAASGWGPEASAVSWAGAEPIMLTSAAPTVTSAGPTMLTSAAPPLLTSAAKQETSELPNACSETDGLAFGPGPLSRSRSASVIRTKQANLEDNRKDNRESDEDLEYATPDSRFTAFSTPDAGYFTPDHSFSAFSTPRSAAYATPDEGFFTPERGGRSASASPGLSRVSKSVSKPVSESGSKPVNKAVTAKPSDWDARKGGTASIGGVSVNAGVAVREGVHLSVEAGQSVNNLEPGESTGAGATPGCTLSESAGVNGTKDPATRGERGAEEPNGGKGITTPGAETPVLKIGAGNNGLTGGDDLELGTGEKSGTLKPVVLRESRPLRSEPGDETLPPQAADVSHGTNADVSAGVIADVSTGVNADVSPGNSADIRTGILADVSASADANEGVGTEPTDLLLVVETGSHLTALGQGPFHTADLQAVTLGRVSLTPDRLTVEWTDRGGQTPGKTAPWVTTRKKRALYSSNSEGMVVPGPVKTEAGHFSVGLPAGVRLTGPEAERAGEWLWTLHRIVVDVVRTDRHLAFYDATANLARMTDILAVYAWRDPEVGYCQGMSDLLSPFVVLFQDDADAFWCFERLMARVRHNFSARGPVGVLRQLDRLREIVDVTDPTVGRLLRGADAENFLFAFRMLLVMFRRELNFSQALMLWEMTWAADFERNGGRNRSQAESGRNAGRNGLMTPKTKRNGGQNGILAPSQRNGGPNGSLTHGILTGSPAVLDRKGDRSGVRNRGRNGSAFKGVMNGMKGEEGLGEGPEKVGDEGVEESVCADDLFVYYVAVILHHNRARLKTEVRELDDALKLFNGMELRIDVRRCVESAVKRRKVFLRKTRTKGKPGNVGCES